MEKSKEVTQLSYGRKIKSVQKAAAIVKNPTGEISINNALRSLRKENGYSQSEAASKLGISLMSYRRYEYGERLPRADLIIKMAALFGCSTDRLLGLEE